MMENVKSVCVPGVGCPLSRRHFLGMAAGGLAGTLLWDGGGTQGQAATDLGEYIDLASLRPRPKVRVKSAVLRLKPPYWLGWPGTSYDLETMGRFYRDAFADAADRVGIELEREEQPLENGEAVGSFIEASKASQPDALLVSLQHMGAWRWADQVAQSGVPTIIFAPVGTAFTGHVLEISRRPGVHVISSLETSAVEQAFRMIRAMKQFQATRLLVVAGTTRKERVLQKLGTQVRYVPRRLLHELFERMPETQEVRRIAAQMRRKARKVVEPTREDLLNAARSYVTARRLLRDENAHAMTTDCLGMVTSKVVPTPPCMAVSMFQDQGVTYGCEADVFGAMSLMLTSYLFDQPGFMNDPVPETVKNVLITAHCVCGTRLNGFGKPPEPFNLRSHSESDLGVSVQVFWKVGQPVTLARFQNPTRLIVDSGTVVGNVDTPPAGGCRTSVEIKMDRVEDVRDVLGFHQVVFYGNHRREVEDFCQMYDIEVIHSPERAPRRETT